MVNSNRKVIYFAVFVFLNKPQQSLDRTMAWTTRVLIIFEIKFIHHTSANEKNLYMCYFNFYYSHFVQ